MNRFISWVLGKKSKGGPPLRFIFHPTEGRINEARVSHRKSSQQHTQAGPKKYTKIANELKNNRTQRGRREAPPPLGRRRRRRPIVFQFICNFCAEPQPLPQNIFKSFAIFRTPTPTLEKNTKLYLFFPNSVLL